MQGYIIPVLTIILFILLFTACYLLISYLKKHNTIQVNFEKLNESTRKATKELLDDEAKRELEVGIVEKESVILTLEKNIIYSGLKKYIPFLNATTYIVGNIIFASLGFIIGTQVWGMIIGIAFAGFVILISKIILALMVSSAYQKVEDNVITFINLIENFSKTDSDIINILCKTIQYLDEPLKTKVEEAYLIGKRTGDSDLALKTLQKNIQHRMFKQIIRSLISCSHYESNYEDVIEDSRNMLMEYLKGKKERSEIARNAKIEIAMLVACSAVVIIMMNSFLSTGIISLLMSNPIGQGILIFTLILIFIMIYQMIFLGKNED